MRRQSYFTALFIFAGCLISAQTGTIAGSVKTSDGQPGAFVSIAIKSTTKGTVADDRGHYNINDVPAGTQTIIATLVGLETREIVTEVKTGETSVVDFSLAENAQQLQEVVISSSGGRYNKTLPSTSLRLNTPILEIPQNIQTVSNEALRDQQVISMSDGLIRNVSGAVKMEHWGDLYANISARGSQIQAFRNGFNAVNSYWGPLTEDMSFVDHIEFVKGPAGFMLANGDPSGLYNVVTKRPTGRTKGEAAFTIGSFDLFRTSLDLDGKATQNGRLLYRFNVSAQNKKSHRPNEFNNRYVIAPVLSYQLDQNTRLTLEYNYQHARMSDVGSYYIFGTDGFATLPRNFTSLPAGMPATSIHDHSMYANIEHRLGSNWKITGQLARFHYLQDGTSMWPAAVGSDGKMIRAVSSWQAKSRMTMGQLFINGDVTTGKVRHRMLAGIDMADKEYFADWGQYHVLDSAGAEFDVYQPDYGVPVNGFPQFDYTTPIEQRALAVGGTQNQNYASAYAQDELGFFDNTVRLTLAGRYTNVRQSYGAAVSFAEQFTPRAGLSVSLDKNTAAYGLYDQAFIPQNGRMRDGGEVKPVTGENTELGIKRQWFNKRWNTTLSVYRITKNNELTADPNSPPAAGLSIELGQKISEGVEFDLRGEIVEGLNLIANYAYTDSRVTKVSSEITNVKPGDIVPGFARHTVNGWITYELRRTALKGLGISAGIMHLSGRNTYWDPSPENKYALPAYNKVDAGVSYSRDRMRIALNVFNIMNEYLYSGSYYSWLNAYYWQTEPGRNFRLSLNYRF